MTKKTIKIANELHKWYKHYSIDNNQTLEVVIEEALKKFKEDKINAKQGKIKG